MELNLKQAKLQHTSKNNELTNLHCYSSNFGIGVEENMIFPFKFPNSFFI